MPCQVADTHRRSRAKAFSGSARTPSGSASGPGQAGRPGRTGCRPAARAGSHRGGTAPGTPDGHRPAGVRGTRKVHQPRRLPGYGSFPPGQEPEVPGCGTPPAGRRSRRSARRSGSRNPAPGEPHGDGRWRSPPPGEPLSGRSGLAGAAIPAPARRRPADRPERPPADRRAPNAQPGWA